MPNFNRSAALKGAEGIREAAERKGGGGDFKPFCPELQWRNDGDEKYILILTPIDDALGFLIHEWVPTGTGEKANGETYKKYEWFMSRKDAAIGEDYDELSDRLDNDPKLKTFGVAVELEPVIEAGRGGRNKVVGFEVKTDTYTKKGEDDELEEVEYPVCGIVMQAAQNFWGWLATFDDTQDPIIETPFQVVRRGKDANTTYDFINFSEKPVDLTKFIENIDGVSYLAGADGFAETLTEALDAESELDTALLLADALLTLRLNELADKERYDELVGPIEEIPKKFGAKKGKAKGKKERPERPKRASRSSRKDAETSSDESAPAEDAAPAEAAETAKPKSDKGDRFAKLRARAEQPA